MTTEKLLTELGARNIRLRRNRDELVLIGNQEALEPSLISQIRAHKASLLEMLGDGSNGVWNPGVKITPEMVTLVDLTQEEINAVVGQVAGGVGNLQDIYPLAPLQEGILFHHLLEGKGDPYLLGVLMRFESRGRLERYVEAVQRVVDRHDILRTGVVWEGLREPVQVVWRRAQVGVEEVELGRGDAGEELYERFSPRRYRIDVRQAPLLRFFVGEDKTDGSWVMMRLVHHLIGDHHSMDVMQEEVGAYLLGREGELPEPVPFREAVAEMRRGVNKEEQERFFREMLGDVTETTTPFGLMEVQGDGTGIEEATMNLEEGMTARIRERARKLKVSAAILFHLGWACVVARTSGRKEAVFGTVLFGQLGRGVSEGRMLGVFINTLPVRIGVGAEGVEAGVRKTQKVFAELARHEHASLVLAQRSSGVAGGKALFTALFNYRHIQAVSVAAGTAGARVWEGMRQERGEERSNYPLTVSVNDLGESASITAQTEAGIGPMRVCGYMKRAMESLLEALEREPERELCTVDVMPLWEREQVLSGWNGTRREYPREKCVQELFEEQVEREPEAVAVAYGEEQMTYGELNRRGNQLAHYLRALGVGPDVAVGICVERSVEMIVGVLGVLKAGGAYVPLDPTYPAERLQFMAEDAGVVVLLTMKKFQEVLPEGIVPKIYLEDKWSEISARSGSNLGLKLCPQQLAYVIYTSGSTGKPKGVGVGHRSIVRLVQGMDYVQVNEKDVFLQMAPVSFDASTFEIWGSLLNGSRLVVCPSGMPSLSELGRIVEEERVTVLWLTAGLFHQMVDAELARLKGIRQLLAGGDVLSVIHVRRVLAELPETWVINGYGPTENTTFSCCHRMGTGNGRVLGETVPIGEPISNSQAYVLDEETGGEPAPVGTVGELYVGGDGLARGYMNRPELTAEKFLPNPFGDKGGERLYRTGDRVKWREDGTLEFLGRVDNQVKLRGYRIELGEIEAVLEKHGDVKQAAVVARESHSGEKLLVAYVVMKNGGKEENLSKLRSYLKERLPEYMAPAAYVRLERLPLTVNGKVDRKALPVPEGNAFAVREYEAPVGEIEETLSHIWKELLRLERVGRKDNFFELGGHSLLALQVVSRVQRQLGREAAVKDLIANPQLESFAAVLEHPRCLGTEHALAIRESGAEPPLFFTHSADDQAGHAWTIAPHIDSNIPIYELLAQPKQGGSRLRTIEGQAQRMVSMIRAVQPAGPYRIAGYCFGSFLAYEIARQLVGADEEVFLALLDFRLISGQTDKLSLVIPPTVNQDLRTKLLTAVRDHVVVSGMPESVETAVLELRKSSQTLEELINYCKDKGWLPDAWKFFTPPRLQRLLVHLVDMERGPYLFPLLPIDVHMFVAREEKWAADLPDDFASLVPGAKMKCFSVPGTHDTMVQNPNAKELGLLLAQAVQEDAKNIKANISAVNSLVCLKKPKTRRQDKSAPLFCVPGTAMRVHCFADLVGAFRGSQPVYGFEARGWNKGALPHTAVEAEAKFYLKALETVSPRGPVHLLGHMRGGRVAFEMALRLQVAGRNVLSLILLDSDVPNESLRDFREYTITEVVDRCLEMVKLSTGRPTIPLSELEQGFPARQRQILLQLLAESGVLPSGAENEELYRVMQILGTGLRTRYMPHRAFVGAIHLIGAAAGRSPGENWSQHKKIKNGWGRWGLSVTESSSPGNRITMLRLPNVNALAEIIEEKMNWVSAGVLSQSASSR